MQKAMEKEEAVMKERKFQPKKDKDVDDISKNEVSHLTLKDFERFKQKIDRVSDYRTEVIEDYEFNT